MSSVGWLLVGLGVLFVLSLAVALGAGAALALVAKADAPFDGCPHGVDGQPDPLCQRFGCPDDPAWIGDRA